MPPRYSRSVSPKTRTVTLEHCSPPDFDSSSSSTVYITSSLVFPYRPFPPSMNIFSSSWIARKTLYVCGNSKAERVYAVDVHAGYGGRPGLVLRNGASVKEDVVLAAACDDDDESQMAAQFNRDSVILLPSLSHDSDNGLVPETMHAKVLDGKDAVGFCFCVEVACSDGDEKVLQRERFEWRSVKKGEEGRFKLVRVGAETQERGRRQTKTKTENSGEVLALLSWNKALCSSRAFALQLRGSGLSDTMGERWTLAVVVTALRIWTLQLKPRSNRGSVSQMETIRIK